MSDPKDRRVNLGETARAAFISDNSRGEGWVQEVSPEGLFLRSPMLPPDGTVVKVLIGCPSGRKIAVEGVVRWNTAPMPERGHSSGFGVRLTKFGDEYQAFVDGALAASR